MYWLCSLLGCSLSKWWKVLFLPTPWPQNIVLIRGICFHNLVKVNEVYSGLPCRFDLSSSDLLVDMASDWVRKLVPKKNCAGLRSSDFLPATASAVFPLLSFGSSGSISWKPHMDRKREREKEREEREREREGERERGKGGERGSNISEFYLSCFTICGVHSFA